ncbi:MAG: hypothetical protein HYV16_02095 [Gammaproteobacteria bacterium]|nr:hypothetical protein [Gammaproteobacteria bacterium]
MLTADGRVRAESLVPVQQPTPVRLLQRVDAYLIHGLKFPAIAYCHSYSELLHLALLEGDPQVLSYVPHPFRLQLGKAFYIPDVYVVRAGQRLVYELKPRGEFEAAWLRRLTAFFAFHGMQFVVLANEEVEAQETVALNYLTALQTVVSAQDADTLALEEALYSRLELAGPLPLGELITSTQHESSFLSEVALFRLLLRGKIQGELQTGIEYQTRFWS